MSGQGEVHGLGPKLLLVLGLLSALAPIATDFYLASFPNVRESLDTDTSSVQLTLTAFLIGLAMGQVLWGPISDHYGRYKPLVVGTTVSAVAALLAVLAPNIEVLIGARFVQALTGAAGVVICRAIVTDRLEGFSAARTLSLMGTILAAAPIIAPIVGGALAGNVSWRAILGIVLGASVLQVVGVLMVVRESLPVEQRTPRLSYRQLHGLFGRRRYLGFVGAGAFTFAMMMAYISTSSFIYQGVLGTSSFVYGLGFALNATGMLVAGLVSARLARRHVPLLLTVSRAVSTALGACVLLTVIASSPLTQWLLLPPLLVAITCVGFVMGNCTALALEQTRDLAGSGSAIMGAMTYLVGGIVSPLGGLAGEDTAVPVTLVMLVCSGVAFACVRANTNAGAGSGTGDLVADDPTHAKG